LGFGHFLLSLKEVFLHCRSDVCHYWCSSWRVIVVVSHTSAGPKYCIGPG
jgi:hypothetical protein